jgi:hypothetical protein
MACQTDFNTGIEATGNITCKRADTFNLKLAVTNEDDASPKDMTVYDTIIMHVKIAAKDPDYILQFSTVDGTIIVYDTNKLELTQVAADMKLTAQGYVYDAEGTEGTIITTLFGGTFSVQDDVTREDDTPAP